MPVMDANNVYWSMFEECCALLDALSSTPSPSPSPSPLSSSSFSRFLHALRNARQCLQHVWHVSQHSTASTSLYDIICKLEPNIRRSYTALAFLCPAVLNIVAKNTALKQSIANKLTHDARCQGMTGKALFNAILKHPQTVSDSLRQTQLHSRRGN